MSFQSVIAFKKIKRKLPYDKIRTILILKNSPKKKAIRIDFKMNQNRICSRKMKVVTIYGGVETMKTDTNESKKTCTKQNERGREKFKTRK